MLNQQPILPFRVPLWTWAETGPDEAKRLRQRNGPCDNNEMRQATKNGIQFVTDEKGRRVAVQIDLKKYGAILEDFWDGLVSESRRKEKSIPYQEYRTNRLKRPKRA
jgi:hypothetical protein